MRGWFYGSATAGFIGVAGVGTFFPIALYSYVLLIPLILVGIYDITQKKRNILRNYPIIGHLRYALMGIRPEIQQYFIETDQGGKPFSKEQRELVYHRAQNTLDTLPFGTQSDVSQPGYECLIHSLRPTRLMPHEGRIWLGGKSCQKPYLASRLNISAMSFGALNHKAVRALNRGAKQGGFAQNTGEGGLSSHHLCEGGDIIWQIGTALFGCRTDSGDFDAEKFHLKASHPAVKMIEIKLSQGAKPGHGGVLPGVKVTKEIAEIRGIMIGKTIISPPSFPNFSTPLGLCDFIKQLRELSGGKPVGFKLCLGSPKEFMSVCKAMLETGIYPDFITVDGGEGGSGAAPVEFSNSIGLPLNESLVFVRNCIVGMGARDKVRIIASGKIISGFDMAVKIALGADLCNIARGMMFALGCVQSRRCNNNTCPTGITTQDPARMYALDVNEKAPRVAHYHAATIESFLEVLGAAGVRRIAELTPDHIYRCVAPSQYKLLSDIYEFIEAGSLLDQSAPELFSRLWRTASSEYF